MLHWLANRVAKRIDLETLANRVEVKLAKRLDERIDSKLRMQAVKGTLLDRLKSPSGVKQKSMKDSLDSEIALFKERREELEEKYDGKTIVMHEGKVLGVFDTCQEAFKNFPTDQKKRTLLFRQVSKDPKKITPRFTTTHYKPPSTAPAA